MDAQMGGIVRDWTAHIKLKKSGFRQDPTLIKLVSPSLALSLMNQEHFWKSLFSLHYSCTMVWTLDTQVSPVLPQERVHKVSPQTSHWVLDCTRYVAGGISKFTVRNYPPHPTSSVDPHRCGSGKSDRLILNSAWTRLPLRMPESEGSRCCLIISACSHQSWSVNSRTVSIIVIIIMIALVVRPPSLWLITPPAAPVFWQGTTLPSQTLVQQGSFSVRGYWIPGICMDLIFIKYHQQTPECLSGRESASETLSVLLCLLELARLRQPCQVCAETLVLQIWAAKWKAINPSVTTRANRQ